MYSGRTFMYTRFIIVIAYVVIEENEFKMINKQNAITR